MTASRLTVAFDRVDDFLAVQGPGISLDAVVLLQEAAGVDAHARAVVGDRVTALADAGHPAVTGSVLLGVLVGLFASEAT